jgi:hypothetical protein
LIAIIKFTIMSSSQSDMNTDGSQAVTTGSQGSKPPQSTTFTSLTPASATTSVIADPVNKSDFTEDGGQWFLKLT